NAAGRSCTTSTPCRSTRSTPAGSPSSNGRGSTPWPPSSSASKETPMAKHTYVYVTYILSTPEKVWEALTDAKISASYWGRENVSDWKVGSEWQHRLPGKSPDVVGEVLESDPPRRLVTTWGPPPGRPERDDPARTNRC